MELEKYRLLLRKNSSVGLFLAEVAFSQAWNLITFLDELCCKAELRREIGGKRMENFLALNLNHGLKIETPLKLPLSKTTPHYIFGRC